MLHFSSFSSSSAFSFEQCGGFHRDAEVRGSRDRQRVCPQLCWRQDRIHDLHPVPLWRGKIKCLDTYVFSSIADPWHFGTDPDPKLHFTYSNFLRIKSHNEVKNSRNQGFTYYFCLIEGFGSWVGSVPRTNGSGSMRHKNIRIPPDLDPSTGFQNNNLSSCLWAANNWQNVVKIDVKKCFYFYFSVFLN